MTIQEMKVQKNKITYKEKSFNFDNNLFLKYDRCDFDGFFQTEKYFKDINTIIGTVIKDIKVDTTIMLEILSTIFFGEYIAAIK